MVEQTQAQIQSQCHNCINTATTTSIAAETDTATIRSPSPPPRPRPRPPPPLHSPPPLHPNTTSSKLPFRPNKSRKLSSTTTPSNPTTTIVNHVPITINLSSQKEIELAINHLKLSDPLLAPLIDTYTPPTFNSSHQPFLSLTKSILYQQLTTKVASQIYSRFASLLGGESSINPESILSFTPQQLREVGISGRKASYLHDLSNKYASGILSDSSILEMDDKSLLAMLTMVKGIGPWSVHMFMIFSLRRSDVLPVGDLGVRKGVQLLYGLERLPKPTEVEQLCENWRPYRSVGSWYMWRFVEASRTPTVKVTAKK